MPICAIGHKHRFHISHMTYSGRTWNAAHQFPLSLFEEL